MISLRSLISFIPTPSSFFILLFRDHRFLLSFPTRRSSDLVLFIQFPIDLHPAPRRASSIPRVSRDRKSTRLNSSHVAISYAVFCLKKKRYTYSASSYAETQSETTI